MRIGIVGSRSLDGRRKDVLSAINNSPWVPLSSGDTVVSGGADGVDTYAEHVAETWSADLDVIEPDYDDWSDGHPALSRNSEIVASSDAVVAVWDGTSNGTRDSIDKALDSGTSLYVEVL